jgi:hypothetical protein
MKQAKIIGYDSIKEHHDTGNEEDYADWPTGHTTWFVYLELEGNYYRFDITASYGSCGSGYTSASWGDMNMGLVELSEKPALIFPPINDIFVNVVNGSVRHSVLENEDYMYDATMVKVNTTDNIELCFSTGDGGCGYYPSGVAQINTDLFDDGIKLSTNTAI